MASELEQAKRELRTIQRQRLRAVSVEEARAAGAAAAVALTANPLWHSARSVLVYVAVRGEIDPLPVAEAAWRDEKRVLLPCPDTAALSLGPREWTHGGHLISGPYGIPVPLSEPLEEGAPIDLAVIPGLAFGHAGGRLGNGLGYYDRWLRTHPATLAVGFAYAWQLVEAVPKGEHDVPVSAVVTPDGWWHVNRPAP